MSDTSTFEERLAEHRSDVLRIAGQLVRSTGVSPHLMDDVSSVGFAAVWEAHLKYDPEHSVAFWAYANRIVRGRMMDFLRQEDLMSRSVRRLCRTEGRQAVVPWHLTDRADFDYAARVVDSGDDPEARLLSGDIARKMLDLLTPIERGVVVETFWGDQSRESVASLLGVTASRVCQILGGALDSLRKRFGGALTKSVYAEDVKPWRGVIRRQIDWYQHVLLDGESKTVSEWMKILGRSKEVIRSRIRRGMTLAEALSKPPKRGGGGSRVRASCCV